MHAGNPDPQYEERSEFYPEEDSNRREFERRQQESKGYTYISMVGWMDRRRKSRRENDEMGFW